MSNTKKFNASLPSMNTARSGCAAAAHGGNIFVMGGIGERTSEMYDIATQQWTTIAPMSTAHAFGAAVSLGGTIIVMGGLNEYGRELSSVEQYDPISKQWTFLPSMKKERSECAAAVVDGKIIAVGGRDDGLNNIFDEVFACGEEFDPDTQEWSEIPPMHFERFGCAAAVLDGQLYVMGGKAENYRILSSAEVYNPTRQWTLIKDMTTPRYNCAAVSLGERIVVVGGFNENYDTLCSCESYNPTTQQWSSMPSLNTKRAYCSAVEVEGNIYVMGGRDGRTNLSSMEYLPYYTFFACLLDEQPDLAKDLNLDDTMMPTFLSFVGRHCKMRTQCKVIQDRQDLMNVETYAVGSSNLLERPRKKARL